MAAESVLGLPEVWPSLLDDVSVPARRHPGTRRSPRGSASIGAREAGSGGRFGRPRASRDRQRRKDAGG